MAYFQMPLGFLFNSLLEETALKWTHLHTEILLTALHRQ